MSYLGRSCGCGNRSHSFKGERKGTQSKTVYRKKSAEAIVPAKGEGLNNSQLSSTTRKQGNLSQNVLMRRVSAYPRGLLKIGD